MLSEAARAAQRAYRKKYYAEHPEARERQREQAKQWNEAHPEKRREYIERYWERKAAEMNVQEE